ncbi:hypothetical protein IF650_11130 [Cellulosimicrobium terreum]|nr:hypothetical protein [Cellulosimicrobium terreum]
MSIHILFLVVLVAAPAAVLAWALRRARAETEAPASAPLVTNPAQAARARRHAGGGALLGAVVALAVLLVVGPAVAMTFDGLSEGLALGLVPAAAGLSFVAAVALAEVTWPAPDGARRSASLVPRTVRDVAPARLRRWSWVSTAVVVLVTLVGGLTAQPDGRSVGFLDTAAGVGGASGPYPGWFYGLPLLVACLLVLGASEVCLRLVVARAAVAGVDATWDLALRRLSSHRLLRGVQLTVGLTGAGMLVTGGQAAHNVATNAASNGASAGFGPGIGITAIVVGIAWALAAIVVTLVPGVPPRSDAPRADAARTALAGTSGLGEVGGQDAG